MKTPFLFLMCWMSTVGAFSVLHSSNRVTTRLALMTVDAPPPAVIVLPSQQPLQPDSSSSSSSLQQGILNHLSTTTLALQERKIPTAEEVQQKKNTFNLIFWGGGFVAPFLATIFYFGFRFWEK